MSITKAKLAERIHNVLGINTRFTEADPSQVIATLTTVDDWMNSKGGIGNRLGWVENDENGDVDPDEETGLPQWAIQGVVYNCALLVAAYFDKQPSQAITLGAMSGMQTIEAKTAYIERVSYPDGMPKGERNHDVFGNKYFHHCNPIQTGGDFLEDEGGDPIASCE